MGNIVLGCEELDGDTALPVAITNTPSEDSRTEQRNCARLAWSSVDFAEIEKRLDGSDWLSSGLTDLESEIDYMQP